MEIKNVILVKNKSLTEFLELVHDSVSKEQKQRRKVEVQYAPLVLSSGNVLYTALITSGVIGE